MRALIINMASATDRMRFMEAQVAALGLPWERVPAVTPDTLDPPADDPVWHRWQRPMRVTEMALCASHMAAWRAVSVAGEPVLVLEDDAVLATDLAEQLARFEALTDVDYVSLETRGRKKLLASTPHPLAPVRRLYQDRTGSAAYVVWPDGARRLLAAAMTRGAPSDALISSTYGLLAYQADPALAVQLDMAERYGLPQAIPTASLIDAVRKPSYGDYSPMQRLGFRLRRIAAQIRMGWRQVRFSPWASRAHVEPATDFLEVSVPTAPQDNTGS